MYFICGFLWNMWSPCSFWNISMRYIFTIVDSWRSSCSWFWRYHRFMWSWGYPWFWLYSRWSVRCNMWSGRFYSRWSVRCNMWSGRFYSRHFWNKWHNITNYLLSFILFKYQKVPIKIPNNSKIPNVLTLPSLFFIILIKVPSFLFSS